MGGAFQGGFEGIGTVLDFSLFMDYQVFITFCFIMHRNMIHPQYILILRTEIFKNPRKVAKKIDVELSRSSKSEPVGNTGRGLGSSLRGGAWYSEPSQKASRQFQQPQYRPLVVELDKGAGTGMKTHRALQKGAGVRRGHTCQLQSSGPSSSRLTSLAQRDASPTCSSLFFTQPYQP